MKRLSHIFVLASLVLLGPGCDSKQRAEPKPGVLANVGGNDILVSELRSEIDRRTSKGLEAQPEKVLDEMVFREVLVSRARQLGLDQDPAVVQAYKNLLIARLKERELEPELSKVEEPSQASDPASSNDGQSVGIAQIRLAILHQTVLATASTPKFQNAMDRMVETRELAKELPASETGFGTLAVERSDDQATRYRGGDLGWMAEDAGKLRYDAAMLETGFALKSPGEVSPVIRGRDGLYLVKLVGRRTIQDEQQRLGQSSAISCEKARRLKRQAAEKAFEDTARAQVQVHIYRDRMDEMESRMESMPNPLPAL